MLIGTVCRGVESRFLHRLLIVAIKGGATDKMNIAVTVCCPSPYVAILALVVYNTVETWFAVGHARWESVGSRTVRDNCLPYYTAGFE